MVGVGLLAMTVGAELSGSRVVGDALVAAVVDGLLQDWTFHVWMMEWKPDDVDAGYPFFEDNGWI